MNRKLIKSIIALTMVLPIVNATAACSPAAAVEQVIKAQNGDIEVTIASDGSLALINDRKLTFQTGGLVKEVNVIEGDRVKAGQVLARLDTQSTELVISSASLAVKSAELELETAKNDYEKMTYPYSYTTFALSVPDSLAAMNEAQRNVGIVQLNIESGVSADELVALKQNLKDALDNLTRAREKLSIGQGADPFANGWLPVSSFWNLRNVQLGIDKAQLGLDRAHIDLEQASDELSRTVITAPFDGVISQVNVKVGDNITPAEYGGKVIFYLVDPDKLELKGTVDEIDVAKVTAGQKANIRLDALKGVRIPGELTYIAPVSRIEGGVVVYDVKIKLEPEGHLPLKSGMTAAAEVITEQRAGVLIIPERSINRAGGNTTVTVVADGKPQERAIFTGITDGINTEITGGLSLGEEIVIEKKA